LFSKQKGGKDAHDIRRGGGFAQEMESLKPINLFSV